MEDLAILHVELLDPSLQLPMTFFLAEMIKNLSTQRKAKKREDLNLLKANILAKTSFLDHIPNLAYVSTTIAGWLKTFFDTPALAPTAPRGPPPPQYRHGNRYWREAHRCDWKSANPSYYILFSCIAEGAASSLPVSQPESQPASRSAWQHRSQKFSCKLLLPPSKTRYTAQLGHPG